MVAPVNIRHNLFTKPTHVPARALSALSSQLSALATATLCISCNMIEHERRKSVDAGSPFTSGPINTAPQFFSAPQQQHQRELDPMQTDENDVPVAAVGAAGAGARAAAATATPTPTPTPRSPAAPSSSAGCEVGLDSTKRKKRMMCVDTSPPPPLLPPIATATSTTRQNLNPFSRAVATVPGATAGVTVAGAAPVLGGDVSARETEAAARTSTSTSASTLGSNAQKPCRDEDRKKSSIDLAISCLEGSTMNIPLSGKTVPFRVVKRRGMGISSVVFECEREQAAVAVEEGEKLGDGGPRVVTIKVSLHFGGQADKLLLEFRLGSHRYSLV